MYKIQLPKPCHEDWNGMNPTQQGAFCTACSKEVIDFTQMTDEEVQHYFTLHAAAKTCGRFRPEQVDRIRIFLPDTILLQKMAGWKKFMAAVLLFFGTLLFGCDVSVKPTPGRTEQAQTDTTKRVQKPAVDTPQLLGRIASPIAGRPVIPTSDRLTGIVAPPPEKLVNGDISVASDTVLPPNMGAPMLLGEPAYIDTSIKKPVSNTSKCKDTGHQ